MITNTRMLTTLMTLTALLLMAVVAFGQDTAVTPDPAFGAYRLDQFGPITTAAQAEETLAKASAAIIAKGGGILIIPENAPSGWQPENNTQAAWRKPEPPAPAKQWGEGAGVTILDYRGGTVKVLVPQLTGMVFSRTLRMPEEQGIGHWTYLPMLTLNNSVVRGSTSYRDWMNQDVPAGKDQRFYVKTTRGVYPGMFLNVGDYGGVQRLYVKSLGYDAEKKAPYFVADTDQEVKARGAILHNKTHTNSLLMRTYAHNEEQTFDVFLDRHQYSQGDTYMFAGHFNYMSDVHSTAGDENGVIYAAFSISDTAHFRGQVDSFDAATHALKYKGAGNAHSLASGRPIINMNPEKWVTGGTVLIVRPGTWWDLEAENVKDPVFEGKTYPTRLEPSEGAGHMELRMGGLMRFSADAPVTPEMAGRYFCVDEADEYVPGTAYSRNAGVRRWYYIHRVTVNPDGTKDMQVIRHWWGAKPANSITLYKPENYTEDGHVKPLKYIIAPGANVYDVADGVKSDTRHSAGALNRTIKLSPGPHTGTALDFASGDPIEQAIGPDPFKPIPFRAWMFDSVPGVFPSPVFDIANHGQVSRHAVMTVGGAGTMEAVAKRADRQPPFENIMVVEAACGNGIVFNGDVGNAAILFQQRNNREQPIKWLYDNGKKEASLTVSPGDGMMHFDGTGLTVSSGLVNVGGLSGSATKSQNLRGINVAIPAGSKEYAVKFAKEEADEAYAVFLELSWLTNRAIVNQTPAGFTVQFDTPPANDGKLHWMLVR